MRACVSNEMREGKLGRLLSIVVCLISIILIQNVYGANIRNRHTLKTYERLKESKTSTEETISNMLFDTFPELKTAFEEKEEEIRVQFDMLSKGWKDLREAQETLQRDREAFETSKVSNNTDVEEKDRGDSAQKRNAESLRFRQEMGASLTQCRESLSETMADNLSLERRFKSVKEQLRSQQKCCALASEESEAERALKRELGLSD